MLFHLDHLVPSSKRIRASNDAQRRLEQMAFLVGGVWTTTASTTESRLDEWFQWSVYRGWLVSNQVTTDPAAGSAPLLRMGAAGLMPHRDCLGLWIFATDGVLVEMAEVGISTASRWLFRSVQPVSVGQYLESCIERVDENTIDVTSRVCGASEGGGSPTNTPPDVRRLVRHTSPGKS